MHRFLVRSHLLSQAQSKQTLPRRALSFLTARAAIELLEESGRIDPIAGSTSAVLLPLPFISNSYRLKAPRSFTLGTSTDLPMLVVVEFRVEGNPDSDWGAAPGRKNPTEGSR